MRKHQVKISSKKGRRKANRKYRRQEKESMRSIPRGGIFRPHRGREKNG